MMEVTPRSTMQEVLEVFPGAQRALFKRYHIGGCRSCAFQPTETLEQLCQRNNNLNADEVLNHLRESQKEDDKVFIDPRGLAQQLKSDPNIKLVDVRSREEFEAVHIQGSVLLSQPVMQEILGKWPREQFMVIVDHDGKTSLDAAAYFAGHGYQNVRALRGGIDAWAQEVDVALPRYTLGK